MVMFMGIITQAQVSGIYTIPGAEYPTIASAIVALNAQGVGSGGVTFNITAGYTEQFALWRDGTLTTTTSSEKKPIIFQKSGTGPNPLVIAGVGVYNGGTSGNDAVFTLGGTDYVTFDGINIKDSPTNTSGMMQMEAGFMLAVASSTDGTQHTTIRNCKIYGFYKNMAIFSTHASTVGGTLNATSFDGTNSFNRIYSDSIVNTTDATAQGVFQVSFVGSTDASTTNFYDYGNEIGSNDGGTKGGVSGGNVFLNTSTVNCQWNQYPKISGNRFTTLDKTINAGPINVSSCRSPMINNNDIGNFTVQGTGTIVMITNQTGLDTVSVTNNYIHDINCSTRGTFTGISDGASGNRNTEAGNQIKNITVGSSSITTGSFTGIYITGGGTGNQLDIHDNILSGNVVTNTATANVNSFIYCYWYGSVVKIYNNTITNNTTNCNGTTNLLNANCQSNNEWEKYIYGNTITNHTNTGGTVNGIYHTNSLRTYIYQNKISGITSTGSAAVINGINFDGGTFGEVYNNYISELYTPASSGNRQVTGLNLTGGSSVAVHYNTIYLDASSSGTNFGTAGIYANTTPMVLLRDNIVDNVSVPAGTGNTIAFNYSSPSRVNYAPNSDFNNYYAGTPGTNRLIYYDGTNKDQTLVAYKVRLFPAEQSSITENTPFMNVLASPYDLHISPSEGSQCESAGVVITSPTPVNVDYYNTPRYPNPGYPVNPSFPPIRPDIGAQEFGGITKVSSPPNVALTILSNTASLTSRSLTATITDLTGVPTSGLGLPVLYWNINNGSWNAATAASLGGDQYRFTFGSGVALNDSVKYYIVAQDLNTTPGPNVGSTPQGATGLTLSPPAATTPPPQPFAYKIVTGACGSYNVGTGGDYATLTAAINDLNTKEITCPVTLLLTNAIYAGETLPISINRIAGLSPVNTLTIKPAPGNNASIQGSTTSSVILINGANYVTIDGSNNGTTSRNLTIWNSNSASNAAVIYLTSPNDYTRSASNDVIKNCNIKASNQVVNTTYGIQCNSATGGGYTNLILDNNAIFAVNIAIKIAGTAAYPALNCQVLNNLVGSTVDSLSMQLYGIYVAQADNTLIQGNEVIGASVAGNTNNNISGIRLFTLATNTKVRKNKVHGLHLVAGSGYTGPWAIYFRAEASSVTEISNNIIYDIQGVGSVGGNYALAGIDIQSGGLINVWDNTVDLEGTCLVSSGTSQSGCIVLALAVTSVDIRNNILKNNLQTGGGGGANVTTFGIYSQASNRVFSNLDNNDYYITGIHPYIGSSGSPTVNYATLASWQAITGQDNHSQNVDPAFVSGTDLHTVVPALNNAGVAIPTITTDFSGVLRTDPPDVGVYEFTLPVGSIHTLAATNANYTMADLHGNINTNGEQVNVFFEYGTTTGYGTTVAALPASVRSIASSTFDKTVTGLLPNTLYHYRSKGVSTTSAEVVYGEDMTFTLTELPTIQGPGNVCQGAVSNVYTTETGKYDYTWTVSAGGTITAGGTTNDNTVTVTWNTAGAQTVTINYRNIPGGAFAPAPTSFPVTVNPPLPVSVSITASNNPVCLNTPVTFTATPVNGGASPVYQWKVNGTNAGANNPVFTYAPVNGDAVICMLTSNAGCNSGSPATSNSIVMSVNSLQPVNVTISASQNPACYGYSDTFTATPVNGGTAPSYQWKVNGNNAGTNTPVYTYVPAYGDAIYCVLTSNLQCPSNNPATSNSISLTFNFPVTVSVTIAASANPVCSGSPVTFTATPANGGTTPAYQWKVNGSPVGTNAPAYTYNPANGDVVTCVLTSSLQCTNGNPATSSAVTMTVNPLLPVSVTVTASANPVTAGTSVTFTAAPVNGGAAPVYQWKVNGNNVGTSNPVYSYAPVNNDAVTCVLTSNATCATGSPATSNTVNMTVNPLVPDNTTVTGTVAAGKDTCFNATQTITVAGGTDTFTVQAGGSATMVAGQNILYLPGTTVELSGYMHGYITHTSEFCGSMPAPIVAVMTGKEENTFIPGTSLFKLYPNPTTGSFTLEFNAGTASGKASVEIYGIRGEKVLNTELTGQGKHDLSLEGQPAGIYFVRLISGGKTETTRIIKL